MAIDNQACQGIQHETSQTPMSRMLNLRNILQLSSTFAEKVFVDLINQLAFHILA